MTTIIIYSFSRGAVCRFLPSIFCLLFEVRCALLLDEFLYFCQLVGICLERGRFFCHIRIFEPKDDFVKIRIYHIRIQQSPIFSIPQLGTPGYFKRVGLSHQTLGTQPQSGKIGHIIRRKDEKSMFLKFVEPLPLSQPPSNIASNLFCPGSSSP